ncbi:hypothetical protein [Alteribacillus iranensis]|uniref:Uncharacterized protein n=1 Tax=Alteribacillus iranensis TaxID=930128 RepID=A0A1I2E3K6_9BACI|nr:hypothetical protein [Alteribacillus iranensis]SFE87121.1 hypothetical protein SAMN05192532_10564 [Alteribacillus iranensis]
MEGVWQVGSLIINKDWVAMGVSLIMAFALLHNSHYFTNSKKQLEILSNTLFLFVIVYQLSSFLFHFSIGIRYPLSVLAAPGAWEEWTVAWIAAIIYLFIGCRKHSISFSETSLRTALIYLLTEFFYLTYMLYSGSDGMATLYHIIIIAILILLFLLLHRLLSNQTLLAIILMVYGSLMYIRSLSYTAKMIFVYIPEWWFLLLVLLIVVILISMSLHQSIRKER